MSLSALKEQRPTIRKKQIQSISKNPEERCLAGWFDGAACATGLNSGAGGVIRINENKIFKWFSIAVWVPIPERSCLERGLFSHLLFGLTSQSSLCRVIQGLL
jgi:hypothetical protein